MSTDTPESTTDLTSENHQILQGDRQLELARLEAITHQSIIQTRLNNQPAKTKSTYDGKKTEFKVFPIY